MAGGDDPELVRRLESAVARIGGELSHELTAVLSHEDWRQVMAALNAAALLGHRLTLTGVRARDARGLRSAGPGAA